MHAHSTLPAGGNFDQTYDSDVRQSVDDGQLTKILIERHQHPAVLKGAKEYLLITRILGPIPGVNDIVACTDELYASTAPNARIEQQLHATASVMGGSTRSRATTRCA